MNETLHVPEEHLLEVINIIRSGLKHESCSNEVHKQLTEWCDEEEEYITQN